MRRITSLREMREGSFPGDLVIAEDFERGRRVEVVIGRNEALASLEILHLDSGEKMKFH